VLGYAQFPGGLAQTDGAAMFMFTQGQAARMNATLAGPRTKIAGLS